MYSALLYIPGAPQPPRGWSERISAYYAPCRYSGEVWDGQEVAGHVLDIPGFFFLPSNRRRRRQFSHLAQDFTTLRGRFICRAQGSADFLPEERSLLVRSGFVFPTGEMARQTILLPAFEHLAGSRARDLQGGAAIVLGADTPAGAEWAQVLAERSGELVLVGGNIQRLERLAEKIRYQTGVAAQISRQPKARMGEGSVVVAAGAGYGDSLCRSAGQALAVLAHPGYTPDAAGSAQALIGGDVAWPQGFSAQSEHAIERRVLLDAWMLRRTRGRITRLQAWRMMQKAGCSLQSVEVGNHRLWVGAAANG